MEKRRISFSLFATPCDKCLKWKWERKPVSTLPSEETWLGIEKHREIGEIAQDYIAQKILDVSWRKFFQLLSYKAENAGRVFVAVNPKGTSRERRERRFERAPREMHKAICADCGAECEVPFKPSGDRPVYCRECYQKHRPKRY